MPIKTNLQSMVPARDRLKKEITLLSKGYSMKDQIPGGVITVYPWDQSIDNWVIKNLRKFSLQLLPYELAKRLVNLKNIDNMPVGDVNVIILVAKALATDTHVEYTATCPACNHKEKINIVVPDQLEKLGEKSLDYPGYDEITLPSSKDVVRIRPLLVKDEVKISQMPEDGKMTGRLARVIAALVAVNEGTPDSIDESLAYVSALVPGDVNYIIDKMDELEPHLGTDLEHKCDSCGTQFEHKLALDAEFFR